MFSHVWNHFSAVTVTAADSERMDLLQKEHERVWKRLKGSKGINDIQATIDLLQKARNTIAAGMLRIPAIELSELICIC